MTQEDVAKQLGVSRTSYLKYENGTHEPDYKTLKKLAEADIVPFVISGKYKPFKKSVKISFFEPLKPQENLAQANEELMKVVSDGIIKEKKENEKN